MKNNCKANCPSQRPRSGKNAPIFSDIDTNNDDMISKEEFSIHQSQRMRN